jgi:hypothetical protein
MVTASAPRRREAGIFRGSAGCGEAAPLDFLQGTDGLVRGWRRPQPDAASIPGLDVIPLPA